MSERMTVRPAAPSEWPAIWEILRPEFRAGDTYAVDDDITEDEARAMWIDNPDGTFVAVDMDTRAILGTYYIKTNHSGHARHVCNCGYVTARAGRGRGIAAKMCDHSQKIARAMGYRAMQFNLVLASNPGAYALWDKLGFTTVGKLPDAFEHPRLGNVDAFVMWKSLT